jgi:O-antigen ligase
VRTPAEPALLGVRVAACLGAAAVAAYAGVQVVLLVAAGLLATVFLPVVLVGSIVGRLSTDQFFPASSADLTLAIGLLAVVAVLAARMHHLERAAFGLFLVATAFLPAFFVAAGTPFQSAAFRELLRVAIIATVFTAFFAFAPKYRAEAAARFAGCVVLGVVGLTFFQAVAEHRLIQGRPPGPFAHPGQLGLFLLLALNFTAAWIGVRSQKGRPFVAAGMLLIAEILALGVTRSVSALVGALFSIIVWLGVRMQYQARLRLLGVTLCLALLLGAGPFIAARLASEGLPANLGSLTKLHSVEWRRENWQGLLDLYEEKPWLGHGLTSASSLNPTVVVPGNDDESVPAGPHSEVVRQLVEGGVVGLAALLLTVAYSLRGLYRLGRRATAEARIYLLGGIAASVGALAMSLSDNTFGGTAAYLVFAAVMGFVVGKAIESERAGHTQSDDAVRV